MKIAIRLFIPWIVISLIGCATPATKEQITPKFYQLTNKNLNLSVIEKRPYVLSGNKSEKFEILGRLPFGIPMTLNTPKESDRFVDYLSNIIKEGFNNSGVAINIVKVEKGASLEDTLNKIKNKSDDKSIVMMLYQSKWDLGGFSYKYLYNYDVFISDGSGHILEHKIFSGEHIHHPLKNNQGNNLTVFDCFNIVYKQDIENIFQDKSIKNAINK